jgi:hypothetical protein
MSKKKKKDVWVDDFIRWKMKELEGNTSTKAKPDRITERAINIAQGRAIYVAQGLLDELRKMDQSDMTVFFLTERVQSALEVARYAGTLAPEMAVLYLNCSELLAREAWKPRRRERAV